MVMFRVAATLFFALSAAAGFAQSKTPGDWAVNNAQIGPDSPIEVPIGGSYDAKVVYPVPDGPLLPLKANVTWWIEPAVKGIFVEAKSGRITVAGSVPHGTTAILYADIPGRKTKVNAKVVVFSPQANPIVGSWRVETVSECGNSAAASNSAASPLASYEWRFGADEQFFIGRPFGIAARLEQSGTYHFDAKTAKLKMIPSWPKDAGESDWKILREADQGKVDLISSKHQNGHGTACKYVLASANTR